MFRLGIAFDKQNVEHAGFQIFLRDPAGTKLEFNFPSHHAPATVKGEFLDESQIAPVPAEPPAAAVALSGGRFETD